MWVAIAVAAVVVIAIAVTVPLVLAGRGDTDTTGTTGIPTTTSTTETSTTTSEETSTTTTSTTDAPPALPGDSAGTWVETSLPSVPTGAYAVSLSDRALVLETHDGTSFRLFAYLFGSDRFVELPVEGTDAGGIDVDGYTAVWWEADYNEYVGEYTDQHVYAYPLPDGPKVEVIGADAYVGYPQIAEPWVTWVEGAPWEASPDENWLMRVFGVFVDSNGEPVGEPNELMPSAIASVLGDSFWTYSLSDTHLAWEQAASEGGLDTGTYVMDLSTLQPILVGSMAWRPSLSREILVYWEDGLRVADLVTGKRAELDPHGDFGSAAPTYAAYYRGVEAPDGSGYEIVARGYTGAYEQVLSDHASAPWLSPLIAVSADRVAFVVDEELHLFQWRPE